ncbi:MAG: DNA repair protein RadA [Coriobacteriia bacterium]|nr:DNA repair protein RadA [Coriobacteriia bacterium]
MAKQRTSWRCQQCGYSAPKWLGRCFDCGEYGTFVEEAEEAVSAVTARAAPRTPVALGDVSASAAERTPTGIPEFDRVLGGGLVQGSLVLLAGEPGIGKSTLLLQAAASLGKSGSRVLYVCGEESAEQVKLRAGRIGADEGISLLPETDIAIVEVTALAERPGLLIVDSIQAMADPELAGVPGSVGQVRACAARLMRVAKHENVTVLLVGHITKEGVIAGPRVLEHLVDTVLSFEGDRDHTLRIVRATKNRFGSVSEIGIFEMEEDGLRAVAQPSGALLSGRTEDVAGSCVMVALEGSRPILVEVQALVTPSYLQMPRRLATGIDTARVLQVLAVLERRAGLAFGQHDVYVSVAGGVRIAEPGIDLPLALALASARTDRPVPSDMVAFGELGLTGELRAVRQVESRLREATRLGFRTAVFAPGRSGAIPEGIIVMQPRLVGDALTGVGVLG